MKFDSADHVAEHFGISEGFNANQWLLVENYIQYGVVPDPDGCLGCDAAYIRTLVGRMDAEPEPEVKEKKKSARGSSLRSGTDDGDRSI